MLNLAKSLLTSISPLEPRGRHGNQEVGVPWFRGTALDAVLKGSSGMFFREVLSLLLVPQIFPTPASGGLNLTFYA